MTIPNRKAEVLPSGLHTREPGLVEGLMLATVCGLAYMLAFYLNHYVVQAQAVFSGVALFYLPAGIKLIAIMVARYWGALGLWAANFLHSLTGWEELTFIDVFWMSVVWVGTTLVVVMAWARATGLRSDLKNLTFKSFVWLNLLAAVVHGLFFNAYLFAINVRIDTEWLTAAKAMALGDFLGSGALMLLVLGLFKAMRLVRS